MNGLVDSLKATAAANAAQAYLEIANAARAASNSDRETNYRAKFTQWMGVAANIDPKYQKLLNPPAQ
jgi:hypothetical protein